LTEVSHETAPPTPALDQCAPASFARPNANTAFTTNHVPNSRIRNSLDVPGTPVSVAITSRAKKTRKPSVNR
jgi:hypothetical protein